jgi:hypothetical protein
VSDRLRSILLTVPLTALLTIAACAHVRTLGAQAAGAPTVQRRGQRLDADGAVRIWNLVGTVRVIGWARDSVAVTARVPDGTRLFFGGGDRGMKVGVEERAGSAPTAALEIRVPHGAKVWVKSATAPITVTGLTGEVELYSVSGEVRVAGRPATLRVESMDAPVTVADGAAWLRARTSAGALRVRGPVDDVVLSTVGGEARLEGAIAQRARIETVTGAVRFGGTVAQGAQLGIDTNAGDVTLAVEPAGVALDLLTLNGRVASTLPLVRRVVRTQGRGQAATVTASDAGRIEVRSFKGAIVVERAGAP